MEEVTNYQVYLDKAINYFFEILPNLVIALIILIGGFWVIKFINRLTKKFFDKKDFDPSLETFLAQLINIALKAILFIIVITQLGVESTSLIAVLGSAGLAIGLALQGSLANFAGGILILIFKPFKIGDFISAQGIDGTVKE
ncbi:mechanosensitive ion channel family protein, partial [Eudoraea sp.]